MLTLPGLTSNLNSSWDYRCVPLCPASDSFLASMCTWSLGHNNHVKQEWRWRGDGIVFSAQWRNMKHLHKKKMSGSSVEHPEFKSQYHKKKKKRKCASNQAIHVYNDVDFWIPGFYFFLCPMSLVYPASIPFLTIYSSKNKTKKRRKKKNNHHQNTYSSGVPLCVPEDRGSLHFLQYRTSSTLNRAWYIVNT
jgi:hypothetical protein